MEAFSEAMNAFACSPPSPWSSSSSSSSCPFLRSLPAPAAAPPPSRRMAPRRHRGRVVFASSWKDDAYGADAGGWLIDEDMVVLRKRLHEMRAAERNYEPPSHWMGWEKRWHASYDADVCRFVGMLQASLMDTRPCVALGVVSLVAMCVPASAAMVVLNLVGAINALLAGVS